MTLSKRKQIRRILLAGFLGNLILLILIIITTLLGLNNIKDNFTSHHDTMNRSVSKFKSIESLYIAQINLHQMGKLTTRLILTTDPVKLEVLKENINYTNDLIRENIEEYKNDDLIYNYSGFYNLNPTEHSKALADKKKLRRLYSIFTNDLRNYEKINRQIIKEVENKDIEQAQNTVFNIGRNSFQETSKSLEKLINLNYTRVENNLEFAEKSYNKHLHTIIFTIGIITILGFMTCIISLLLAYTSINTISKNYNDLYHKENELIMQNQKLQLQERELIERNNALKNTKNDLEEANKELIIINKSLTELDEMKNNFISTVSHELRTPLTSIKGSLGLIINGMIGEVNSEITSFLTVCYRNTDKLIHLINDMLDISKIESGKLDLDKKEYKLKDLINETIEGISGFAIEQSATIETKLNDDVVIYADHNRINQVLYNLISNAIKFSSAAEGRKSIIEVSATQEKTYVQINVKDNGIGIPNEMLDKVFDKFTQIDNSSKRISEGSGLGLAITKAIIDEHKGRIWINNRQQYGVTISFTIASKELQDNHTDEHYYII